MCKSYGGRVKENGEFENMNEEVELFASWPSLSDINIVCRGWDKFFFVKSQCKDNLIFERRMGDRTLCADEVVIGGALYKEVVKGANVNLFGGGGRHGL